MSSDIWSRECAGGRRVMARTPVCDCVRVRVLHVRVRVLGVWPYGLWTLAAWRFLTLGVWPYGLWTLAAWRCLICAASVGVGISPDSPPSPSAPMSMIAHGME